MIKQCPKCRRQYETTNSLCPVDGSALESMGDPLEGQVLADKYRIEERLSAGGMGAVYRATHVLMDKKVAVKVLHPSLASDEQIVQRFTREARAASRISHPHALNVTDFGESENGIVFLVMEYLRGRTLKEVIREEGALPLPRAVEIMRQVAGALDAAHAEGVVHRDLKSDNIMLEEVGGHQDWAKVLDFGIAKIQEPIGQDPALTAPNIVIGTPQYMSPEQCSQSSNIDKRSDIYSLGIIIFEMLTTQAPFTGASPTAIMMKQLQDAPPSVLDAAPDVPPAVDAVIQRALAKKPEDRFDSAGEFADALAQAAGMPDAASNFIAATSAVVVADTNPGAGSTAANEDRIDTAGMDAAEETTVVSGARVPLTTPMTTPMPAPSGVGEFNPVRVMIPAALVLIAIIGLVYAFSGDSNTGAEDAPGALRADPNSQPVQPITPATTGASERDIAPRDATVTTAPATGDGASGGGTSSAPGAITSGEPIITAEPTLTPDENANANNADGERDAGNENAAENVNANRNANRRSPPLLNPPTTGAPANLNAPPPPPAASSPRPTPSPRRRTPQTAPTASPAPPADNDESNP